MIDITIEKVDEVYNKIVCDPSIAYELSDIFTFQAENYKYNPKFKTGVWDGKIRLFNPMQKRLYAGLTKVVKNHAKACGYTVEDRAIITNEPITMEALQTFFVENDYIRDDIDIREYQWLSVLEAINSRRMILKSPTSSGKSLMAFMMSLWFLHHEQSRVLLIVPTTALVLQMRDDFIDYSAEWFKGKLKYHTIFDGASKNVAADITISTWQSLYDYGDATFFSQFKVVIGDEAHGFKAKSLIGLMTNLRHANVRLGMSGTVPDTKASLMTLMGLFGHVYTATTLEEMFDKGHATRIKVRPILLQYDKEDKKILAQTSKEYDDEIAWIITNQARNKFITNLALSRDTNTIVLFRYIEHGKLLHKMIQAKTNRKVHLIYGKVDAEVRNDIRKEIDADTNSITVASYKSFATGSNVKKLQHMIFAHPMKSETTVMQSVGRVLRLHESKDYVFLYDLSDDLRIDKRSTPNHTLRHFMTRVQYYDNEKFDVKSTTYKV